MARVRANGAEVEYVESGRGEPLILVHGSGSDRRTWKRQQEAFSRHFRVISYSRRYHWPNEPIPPGADYSMLEHVDDLREIVRVLDATPAHVVGHSYGAFVSLLFAQENLGLVRTLALSEPPVLTLFVSSTPQPMELLKLFMTRPRTALAILRMGASGLIPAEKAAERGDMEQVMQRFGTAVLGRTTYQNLSEKRKQQVRDNLIRAEFVGSGFPQLDDEALRKMQTPTLLVMGGSSRSVFHLLVDRLEELLPRTERIDIPGASHLIHEDNASAYNSAVMSFLDGHRATA
ncbi:alpha/beta hydrolase [Longibacter salinarum]|uniref:Alpha/beta hydrolase n=1 Tax=Longibacter salinarum TaxID=1850348 RepID=A0A2A8CWP1_9BACT|nr:alpha/beta hydrolase [Longibacter salinarum]PEN13014.1 alpha/beta hydrolase [Longibacter salinarum]